MALNHKSPWQGVMSLAAQCHAKPV